MQKVLFIDIDGTLVDYENNLPDSAIQAIRQARANGHLVYLVTGRSKGEMYEEIWEIGLDGYIGGNGNYIENGNQVLYHEHLTADKVDEITGWLDQHGLAYYLEANEGLYASPTFEADAEPFIQAYVSGKDPNQDVSHLKTRDVFVEMIFDEVPKEIHVNKISFVLPNELADYEAAVDRFGADYQVGHWGGTGGHPLFGDVALAGIDKKTAIKFLLEKIGKTPADSIAFGDARVDLPMFEICQESVAVGNATDLVKSHATYVTADVEDDGLYKAFQHFNLID